MATRQSLQRRVLWMVLGAVTAVWLVTAVIVWREVQHELDELLDGHLAQAAALLVVQQSGESIEHDSTPDAPTLHRYAPKVVFQVWHEGVLVRRSAQAPLSPLAAHGHGYSAQVIDGQRWRVFSTRGDTSDVVVHVGESVSARTHILTSAMRSMLTALGLALPMLALLIWWAVRRGMTPLAELARTLKGRHAEELAPIELAHAPTEMTPAIEALNALFVRIEGLLASERRFTADAAHELRTPVSAIRTQAQVALMSTTDEPRQHALQATMAGCDRAARLIDQLLMLARLEAGDAPPLQPTDWVRLTRTVIADLADKALDKAQTIELDAPAQREAMGNEPLLMALIRNLVDNAIRYCPEQAHIIVHIPAEGLIQLTVDDSGPGMTEADLRRLGERFFRASGHVASGSGLGWSIATRIAKVHGCQLLAQRSDTLKGLQVAVVARSDAPSSALQ